MASGLLNNTLSSLSSGVTQQYQEGRFDSQVDSMVNCIPSLTRGVMRRNPIEAVRALSEIGVDISKAYTYTYDRGTGTEQYLVIIPGDGRVYVYNINDGSVKLNDSGRAYLVNGDITKEAKDVFKALTIGDFTFVVNTTITTALKSTTATTHGYSNMAFYWIKKTASVVTNQYQTAPGSTGSDPIQTGSLIRGYDYTLNGVKVTGTEDTRPTYTPIDLNTGTLIAGHFTYQPGSLVGQSEGSICYASNFTGSNWTWEDSFGSEASLGVWKTVKDVEDLPAQLPSDLDGFIVKVSGGTSAEFDDYYLKYNYTSRSWKECLAPGVKYIIDENTMPHVLYRMATGNFSFQPYSETTSDGIPITSNPKWGQRTVGGENDLEDPSFLGRTILNIFFYKNRLGFLTSDNVILSQTGDYGNFFVQTLQEVLDDDPIDLAVASTDVTILRHAVPTAGQLLLFADDTQFTLSSIEGALTPNTADISALSNYTYGKGADARAIGNRVFFSNQAGGYSQIYSYRVSDKGSQITEANPMTIHLPSYIDKSVSRIVGHDVLGYTFIQQADYPRELIVLSSVIKGNEELQNAFHKWTFAEDIVSVNVVNNALYILFNTKELVKMSLEIPGSINDIEYLDEYNITDGGQPYESSIKFSEFYYRDAHSKGTVRGRLQLRTLEYTIEEGSKYITDISNKEISLLDTAIMYGPEWDDTGVWTDNKVWIDVNPFYTRAYTNDSKVTVMSNSKTVEITFKSSTEEPSKGFELATANIEAFFHQRSTRV